MEVIERFSLATMWQASQPVHGLSVSVFIVT